MIVGDLIRRFWPYITIAALVLLAIFLGRRNKALNEMLVRAEARIRLQKEMRDAGDAVATDRDSITDRLRDGKF